MRQLQPPRSVSRRDAAWIFMEAILPRTFDCDAVLFDLDGVLVDSSAVVERHWTRWARKQGLDPSEVIRTVHGRRPVDTIRKLMPDLEDPVSEADRIAEGESGDLDGMHVLPGGKELAARLPEGRWIVATSGPRKLATARLRYASIPVPEALVTAEEVERGKPDPAPYLLAAERLGVAADRCVVFEDSDAGVRSGKAAGAQVIGVLTTHRRDELEEAGADCIINDLTAVRVENGPQAIRLVVLPI